MVDIAQIILLSVIVILTVLLLFLGIQAFFVLRDFRKTIGKTNKILDEATKVTDSISSSFSSFSSIVAGVRAGVSIMKILQKKDKSEKK